MYMDLEIAPLSRTKMDLTKGMLESGPDTGVAHNPG